MHACPHPGATSQRCLGGTTVVAGLQRRLSEAARCSHRAAAHALARPPVPCEKVCLRITSVSYWQSLMGWCETNYDSGAVCIRPGVPGRTPHDNVYSDIVWLVSSV
jgi:hypothetical protein